MMSRVLFMKELESLLSDIPKEEKEEALKYYNDYFEDAGAEHEEEILKELVSPQRVASIIKLDLGMEKLDQKNRGSFTEQGYQDSAFQEERYELDFGKSPKAEKNADASSQNRHNTDRSQNQQQSTRSSNNRTALIILLCIFAIPIGVPLIISFFAVMFGVVAAIVGVILGFGISGVAMMGVGLALAIAGVIKISIPFLGLVLCGTGLIVLGVGMLFTLLSIVLCKKVLPALIRGIVTLCRLPFRNRSVIA